MRVGKGRSVEKRYWDVTSNPVDFDFTNGEGVRKKIRELMLTSVERKAGKRCAGGSLPVGGIDSSVVVGLMAAASSDRPNTFNISFEGKRI